MNTNLEILETLALKDGRWQNWALHWARLQITAQHFRYPLMQMQAESDMERIASQTHSMGDWRVRLALSATGEMQITAEPLPPTAQPVALQAAHRPIANAVAYSDVVRFKTSVRQHYDAFRPQSTGIFDIVLFNEDGQITEGTRGNIAVQARWALGHAAAAMRLASGRGAGAGLVAGTADGAGGDAGAGASCRRLGLHQ